MGTHIFFLNLFQREYMGSRFYRDEFETSQSMNCVDASYECTLAVLECSTIISNLIFRSTKNRKIFLFVFKIDLIFATNEDQMYNLV